MKSLVAIICFSCLVHHALSQQNTTKINFICTFNKEEIKLNQNYYSDVIKDSIQFTVLKFYVGNICFSSVEQEVISLTEGYHLIDWEEESTRSLLIPGNDKASKISFTLGVDSLTNNSGAMGGDLDPTKGMYWTWQSGYINFKLEGKSPVCKTRKNEFTFHLGGYQEPFYAMQSLSFFITDKQEINLILDLNQLMQEIDLSKQNQIMSPSEGAVNLSKIVAASFKISEH